MRARRPRSRPQSAVAVPFAGPRSPTVNSAEVYPSNGLFRKLWGKLLAASVTEAIGERSATADGPPEIDAVQAFLASGERGETSERVLPADVRLISRDADKTLFVESRRADGAWLHRSYLVK